MDAKQATALRKPFDKSQIGRLPKGGTMLDYVGHAATTDRLLQVDPEWSWEPFATDTNGLPALDQRGNLWIRLTVCGVTRIGVGDGKSAKECIGDAIRNAAMRFGVALDLWAKEDLTPTLEPIRNSLPPQQEIGSGWDADAPVYRSEAQSKKLAILLRELGMTDRDEALAYIGGLVGRQVESTKTLTPAEASRVIDALSKMQADSVNPRTGEVPR